eukprot:scaffold77783_cov66-Phaeocystis_antarctica.AAC.2
MSTCRPRAQRTPRWPSSWPQSDWRRVPARLLQDLHQGLPQRRPARLALSPAIKHEVDRPLGSLRLLGERDGLGEVVRPVGHHHGAEPPQRACECWKLAVARREDRAPMAHDFQQLGAQDVLHVPVAHHQHKRHAGKVPRRLCKGRRHVAHATCVLLWRLLHPRGERECPEHMHGRLGLLACPLRVGAQGVDDEEVCEVLRLVDGQRITVFRRQSQIRKVKRALIVEEEAHRVARLW